MAVEELTSGASGRIIPIFKKTLILLYSSLICFFLLFSPKRRFKPSHAPKLRRRVDEEEDTLRRRALALAQAQDLGEEEEDNCRCTTSIFYGVRRNALFCRSWFPIAGNLKGIIIIIHGLNEHGGRYAQFARQLISCNFGVYAMDWIGHGGSDVKGSSFHSIMLLQILVLSWRRLHLSILGCLASFLVTPLVVLWF